VVVPLGYKLRMRHLPPLADGTVVSLDPDGYKVWVSLDLWGGQTAFLPVDVLTHGPRDAVRGHYRALPTPGTRGTVGFTRGDDRSGRWLGATSPALPDASPHVPGSGYLDYHAEYAGGWSWLGQDGTLARVWADGSTFLAGPTMPVPVRHIVNASGQRVPSVFTPAQRNPSPPGAFPFTLNMANGCRIAVTAAGSVSVLAPAGQTASVTVSGGASVVLAGGAATVTASGQPLTLTANGATATLNTNGSISLVASGAINLTAAAGQRVTVTAGGTPAAVQTTAGTSPVLWADG